MNQRKRASKHLSSESLLQFLTKVPALTSLKERVLTGNINQISPFLFKLVLEYFITVTKRQTRIINPLPKPEYIDLCVLFVFIIYLPLLECRFNKSLDHILSF